MIVFTDAYDNDVTLFQIIISTIILILWTYFLDKLFHYSCRIDPDDEYKPMYRSSSSDDLSDNDFSSSDSSSS